MRRILSIDGGGIRGVFPARYLAVLEEQVGAPIHEYFDLIAGTSTGGIIAIGLAMGVPATEIADLYEESGEEIFGRGKKGTVEFLKRTLKRAKWLHQGEKHDSTVLEKALNKSLGGLFIGDAKTRLFIPSWDESRQAVYIYKTAHHARFSTDYKRSATEAAMATASAPTYFRKFTSSSGVGLVDGGVWANNPTGLAVVEAIGTLGWPAAELKVLSISCLDQVGIHISSHGALKAGIKLFNFMSVAQSAASLGIAHTLTGHVGGSFRNTIWRISVKVPSGQFEIDDTNRIGELAGMAASQARTDGPNLVPEFFGQKAEPFVPCHRRQ